MSEGKAKLFGKMAKVLGEVSRVPKNGRNEFHRYDYVTESDLVDLLRGLMAKNGIAFFVSCEDEPTRIDMGDGKNGPLTRVKMTAHFGCSETGETMSVTFYGEGQDKGDKGVYKAYTGAIKYMLMKTFLVSTGDDPEVDDDPAPTRKPTGAATYKAPAQAAPAAEPFDPAPARKKIAGHAKVTPDDVAQSIALDDRASLLALYNEINAR